MKTMLLGKSSLQCSRVGYGCWRIAGHTETGEVSPERLSHAREAILAAFETGVTFFDHADVYADGVAETIFGQVLRQSSGMRDRIQVATKCGIRKAGRPEQRIPYRYDFSREHIVRSCEESLQRLGLERIDLFQLHRPDYLARPDEVAEAFVHLQKSGKVREFGLSNASPQFFDLIQKACPMPLVVNQVEINLLRTDALQDGTLIHCQRESITPIAWSPLGGGKVTYSGQIDLHDPDHARRLKLREILDGIARDRGLTRTAIAIAWLLAHPAGILPLIGSTNPRNIKDAISAQDVELTREEWYSLMEASLGRRLP
jgi:predicted oxidoreductase